MHNTPAVQGFVDPTAQKALKSSENKENSANLMSIHSKFTQRLIIPSETAPVNNRKPVLDRPAFIVLYTMSDYP